MPHETVRRQRHYRARALGSVTLYGGTTFVALAGLDRLGDLFVRPAEFASPARALQAFLPSPPVPDAAFVGALAAAIAMGASLGALAARRWRRAGARSPLGDIEALLPRNRAESWHVALLGLNAGLSEEPFFRLLLPLLLSLLGLGPIAAFALSLVAFGLVHAYQGWRGVAASTLFGAALSALYLSTGALWLVIAVHALLDLVGLLGRPASRSATAR